MPTSGKSLKNLTYSDKKAILAAALRIREWNVLDCNDTEVFYSMDDENTNYKGHYKRTYSIDADNKVTLGTPVQVVKRTVYEEITVVGQFSLDDAEVQFASDEVILSGKVFECGEYPDKNFSLTEEEADEAIANFSPVSNDLEHKNTVLDGQLGQLRSVWRKGKELYGKVAVPDWFYNQVKGSKPLKVSLAWNKGQKRIVGNALTLNPRIKDAQLVAAFNEASSLDIGGNIVKTKFQEIIEGLKAKFSKGELAESDFDIEKAEFADDTAPEPAGETKPPAVEPNAQPAPAAQPTGDAAKFAEENATLRSINTGLQAKMLDNEAAAFVDGAIKAGKVFPSERQPLIAQFKQAAQDDNADKACFSGSGELVEGPRLKALREGVDARPVSKLVGESLVGADELVVMSADGGSAQKMSDSRRQELINTGSIKVTKEGK